MNELSIIEFEGSKIRCVGTPDRPEWVAADVCRVLGIDNPRQALSRLDSDEKGVTIGDTLGGSQEMATLTEPGLYKLVSRSRKPIGKRFSRFIFHEVLPCIRKHGCYPEPEVSVGSRSLVVNSEFMREMGAVLRDAVFGATEPLRKDVNEVKTSLEDHREETNRRFNEQSKRLDEITRRRELTEETKRIHVKIVASYYRGVCPCCRQVLVVNSATPAKRLSTLQFDHFHGKTMNDVKKTWAVCVNCNSKLRDQDFHTRSRVHFDSYQECRKQFMTAIKGKPLFDGDEE